MVEVKSWEQQTLPRKLFDSEILVLNSCQMSYVEEADYFPLYFEMDRFLLDASLLNGGAPGWTRGLKIYAIDWLIES